jgi:hypothetical protein
LGGEQGAVVEDDELAAEEFADLDAIAAVGTAAEVGGDMNAAGAHADGVIAGDDAVIPS